MIPAKKKPSLAVLIGIGKPPPGMHGHEPDDHEDEEGGDPHADAASAILDAVESKDPEGLSEALQAFYQLCRAHDEDEGSEGAEEEDHY